MEADRGQIHSGCGPALCKHVDNYWQPLCCVVRRVVVKFSPWPGRDRRGLLVSAAQDSSGRRDGAGTAAGFRYQTMTKQLSSTEAQMTLGLGSDIPTERLFFAVMPDALTAERVAELADGLREEHGLAGHPLAPERLHVTLHHLGDYAGLPPSLLPKVRQAAARVRMPEFEVCFDQVGSFAGSVKNPFVLRSEYGAELLNGLHEELARCLQGVGGKLDPRFTPHMTLLYDRRRLPIQPVQPLRWFVREFVLVRSFLGQGRYQIEGRWQLG